MYYDRPTVSAHHLSSEFTVTVPLQRVWETISDLGTIAACLPGAELRAADGAYTGRIELRSDGVAVPFESTLRAVDLDEDEHALTVALRGRQLGGPAVGLATITGRALAGEDCTRVSLGAEIQASGYEPSEALDGAGDALLRAFGERLEQQVRAAPAGTPVEAPLARPASKPTQAAGTGRGRAVGGLLIAAGVLAGLRARRRRRSVTS
jgi:carbon monoxide dehydrogenase subunit G